MLLYKTGYNPLKLTLHSRDTRQVLLSEFIVNSFNLVKCTVFPGQIRMYPGHGSRQADSGKSSPN